MTAHASNDLAELVKSLREDLLFAMSRGSKELFHSDTLAWFLERFGFLRETLFAAWQVSGAPSTEGKSGAMPELRNLDLVIHHPGSRPLVVENKVFSLPDTSQLDRYADQNLGDLDAPALVLLSLVDPLWPADEWRTPTGHTWRFRSYHELGAALRPCLPELRRADRFAAETFERWLLLVEKIVALANGVGTPSGSESLVLSVEDTAVLQRARLDATVQKMRYFHTARRIQAELNTAAARRGVVVQSAMSRGQGIVEMFTALPGPALGWQIQEGQFRLVYLAGKESGHGSSQAARRVRGAGPPPRRLLLLRPGPRTARRDQPGAAACHRRSAAPVQRLRAGLRLPQHLDSRPDRRSDLTARRDVCEEGGRAGRRVRPLSAVSALTAITAVGSSRSGA